MTVNPLPVITASPTNPSICNGASVLLTAGGGSVYIWSPCLQVCQQPQDQPLMQIPRFNHYLFCQWRLDANGCTNTASITVIGCFVWLLLLLIQQQSALCNGQSVSLTASGANTYVWSPGTALSATTGATVSANPSATITYTVTGTIAGGCTATKTVTVTVKPVPAINASSSDRYFVTVNQYLLRQAEEILMHGVQLQDYHQEQEQLFLPTQVQQPFI